jgi:hypothetical protein
MDADTEGLMRMAGPATKLQASPLKCRPAAEAGIGLLRMASVLRANAGPHRVDGGSSGDRCWWPKRDCCRNTTARRKALGMTTS